MIGGLEKAFGYFGGAVERLLHEAGTGALDVAVSDRMLVIVSSSTRSVRPWLQSRTRSPSLSPRAIGGQLRRNGRRGIETRCEQAPANGARQRRDESCRRGRSRARQSPVTATGVWPQGPKRGRARRHRGEPAPWRGVAFARELTDGVANRWPIFYRTPYRTRVSSELPARKPASPNTCVNLLTGGLLVRIQPEEPLPTFVASRE